MSIWSSEQGGDVRAVDLHDSDVDQYKATGDPRLEVDVATATSWNDRIRLSIYHVRGEPLDVCAVLDRADATLLRDHLTAAIDRLARLAEE